jgi:hypothetical protein
MAIQSIRAPVQIGHVAGNHFFVAAREVPLREVDRVSKLDHLAQKVRPRSETLDDARYSLSSRTRPPDVIRCRRFACGFGILDDFDLRGRFRGRRRDSAVWGPRTAIFVRRQVRPPSEKALSSSHTLFSPVIDGTLAKIIFACLKVTRLTETDS